MSFWNRVRRVLKAIFAKSKGPRSSNPVESIARTMEESTHVRGGRFGLPRASTEQQHEIVIEGHESYVESLDDDD